MAAKFRKGDRVQVLAGKDKGAEGEILHMLPERRKAIVRGINISRRHQGATRTGPGGMVDKEMPIALSNLAHLDPADSKPVRVGFKFLDDGRKVRYAKRSGEVIDG